MVVLVETRGGVGAPGGPFITNNLRDIFLSWSSSWRFQPIWKILVKLDHFPKVSGWNKKSLKPQTGRWIFRSRFFPFFEGTPNSTPKGQGFSKILSWHLQYNLVPLLGLVGVHPNMTKSVVANSFPMYLDALKVVGTNTRYSPKWWWFPMVESVKKHGIHQQKYINLSIIAICPFRLVQSFKQP